MRILTIHAVTVRVSYSITGEYGGVEYFNSHLGEVFAENSLAHFGATDIGTPIDPSFNLTKFPTLAGSIALVFNLGLIQNVWFILLLLLYYFKKYFCSRD